MKGRLRCVAVLVMAVAFAGPYGKTPAADDGSVAATAYPFAALRSHEAEVWMDQFCPNGGEGWRPEIYPKMWDGECRLKCVRDSCDQLGTIRNAPGCGRTFVAPPAGVDWSPWCGQ